MSAMSERSMLSQIQAVTYDVQICKFILFFHVVFVPVSRTMAFVESQDSSIVLLLVGGPRGTDLRFACLLQERRPSWSHSEDSRPSRHLS